MSSLIDLFYRKELIHEASQRTSCNTTTNLPQSLKGTMEQELRDYMLWASVIYQDLGNRKRQSISADFEKCRQRIDEAYHEEDWARFQSALLDAKTLLRQHQSPEDKILPCGRHWIYQAWSRVLDAEVWFVCCDQEVVQLVKQGVSRGAIYTESELEKLFSLTQSSPETLKNIHLVKTFFDGTLILWKNTEFLDKS